ncbi:CD206 [Mytilus edulis]|uniref:MRC n=1 Tax=Mytilus edulis TaxID=6550 RepID=A0A8S3Q427_MYTED|nr:CD206 [Mytilus edulis]
MLSFSCHRYVFGTRTQSYLDAHCEETKITDIEKEVCAMKENYKALLQRVDDNEQDIASLRGQKQLLEKELENTIQAFSCEIENLHDITVQQKLELNDTNHSWTTFNETTHKLIHRVNVLDNHYLLPGRCGVHSNKTDSYINCVGGWVRRADFGALYCFRNDTLSWDDAQEECRRQNGWLADIYSANEAKWLTEYSPTHLATSVWIGGKLISVGTYKWVTSNWETRGMDYTRWAPDEPKPRDGYKCVNLWKRQQYKWDNYDCDVRLNFICKIYI